MMKNKVLSVATQIYDGLVLLTLLLCRTLWSYVCRLLLYIHLRTFNTVTLWLIRDDDDAGPPSSFTKLSNVAVAPQHMADVIHPTAQPA